MEHPDKGALINIALFLSVFPYSAYIKKHNFKQMAPKTSLTPYPTYFHFPSGIINEQSLISSFETMQVFQDTV